MKKQFAFTLLLALAIVASIFGGRAKADSPVAIGQPVGDFKALDLSGKEQTLASVKGQKGTVLIFLSTQCPVVKAYIARIEQIAEDYRARGINVVGINSNSTEPMDDVKNHASANKLSFTVLKDNNNKIADQLGALHTPEAFVLDASGKLVYHGRVDNNRDLSQVTSNDLRDALDAVIAGKQVAKPEAAAFGCSIKRTS